jgi:hypothetical protein
MKVCAHCRAEFEPLKTTQKYCSNTCRVKSFNARLTHNLTPNLTHNNDTMNEQINAKKIIDETVERILMERQQVFETKLKAQEAEYNNKLLELRLSELEKKVKDLEKETSKDDGGFGISMPDMMNAAATYFATKMSTNTTTNETSK